MEKLEKVGEKNTITEFAEVKAKIAELHREHRTRLHGMRFEELFVAMPKEWDDFVEYGADDLKLDEKDAEKFDELIKRLLDGELTADDEQELKSFMTRYEATEHPQRGQANGV